ncbi:MAG: hypothetical protein HPY85_10485 [Anaerolineae bacterium]|nr:hypothetical protein [Anaerolineae bacterium]
MKTLKTRLFGLLIIALLLAGCTGWQVRTETPTPVPEGTEVVIKHGEPYKFDGLPYGFDVKLTLESSLDCASEKTEVMLTLFTSNKSGMIMSGTSVCVVPGSVVTIPEYSIKVLAIDETESTLTLEIANQGTDR